MLANGGGRGALQWLQSGLKQQKNWVMYIIRSARMKVLQPFTNRCESCSDRVVTHVKRRRSCSERLLLQLVPRC